MNGSLECPFCNSTGWRDETDRLAHVLVRHSARLFMCSAVLREFRLQGVSWDTYSEWLLEQHKTKPGLGR